MSAPRYSRALQLVGQLQGAGLNATADPHDLPHKGAGVLVVPPRLTFDLPVGASATWSLYVVDAHTVPGPAVWQRLDELLDELAGVLPLSSAEPASYSPMPTADPRPAYLVTYEEAV